MFEFTDEENLVIDYIKEGCKDYSPNCYMDIDLVDLEGHEADVLIFLPIDTLYMTEDNYNDYISYCDNFEYVTEGLAGCDYDADGYDYWTNKQKESNYALVVAPLEKLVKLSDDELDAFLTQVFDLSDNILDLQTMTEEEVEARESEE